MTCDQNLATTLSRDLNGLWRAIAASILRRVNIPLEMAAQYEGIAELLAARAAERGALLSSDIGARFNQQIVNRVDTHFAFNGATLDRDAGASG